MSAEAGETLSLVVHGESGVGKSWLGDTTPAPRLVLDAEGGSRFTNSRKYRVPDGKGWDGKSAPPVWDGTWDTCAVTTRDFATIATVFQWLASGQHPFRSVTLDSLTEIQKRCLDAVAGVNQPTQQDWGELLRKMEKLVRDFRDLTLHPTKPLEAVVIICVTSTKEGRAKPHVQGQLAVTLPYFVDVVGYLFVQADEHNQPVRRLAVQPLGPYDAKDRTNRLGLVVDHPNVETMLARVYGRHDVPPSQDTPYAPPTAAPAVDPNILAAYQAYLAQQAAAPTS